MIDLSERMEAMGPLEKGLRNKLERTVKEAREIAETGAAATLQQLGVGDGTSPSYLTGENRELRKKLRIHARQLGDKRHSKTEKQEIERLTEEVAYQHWHRMLFARFLAENDLLMYPGPPPVAITLEECEELAAEEGAKNGWELASRFASQMLPQIFRPESPVFKLQLPPEHEQKLEELVQGLPSEVFAASDSLGWIYQFWQSKRKEEVNAAEVKIGARELPAVTQLFTEPYMVSFLLDNSLGAWWAARRLTEEDLGNAASEDELRKKASIPGVPLRYLRFVKLEDGTWTPAAGIFDSWPEELAQFTALDPCCGSGHFLVAAFLMLVPIRMDLERLSAREAVDRVLSENIHGLEIDQRCVELAAFALALSAWRYPKAGGYRALPILNVACSGLSVSVGKEEWKGLALDKHNLRIALDWMHDTFNDAPVLGSLLNPAKTDAAKLVSWDELSIAFEQAFDQGHSDEEREAAVVAQGLARAAVLLSRKYHWVITNVPYLVRGKHNEKLAHFCETQYSTAKNDLATVFLDRCLELCVHGGTASIVLPQNWLFLTTYKKFREKLLRSETWHLIARLGAGAFDTISGEIVKAVLLTLSRGLWFRVGPNSVNSAREAAQSPVGHGGLMRGTHLINCIDVSNYKSSSVKAVCILSTAVRSIEQGKQLDNPDARIVLESGEVTSLLSEYAHGVHGFGSKDSPRYFRQFWELIQHSDDWQLMSTTVKATRHYGGKEQAVFWQQGKGILAALAKKGLAIPAGEMAWGKCGVAISQMKDLPGTLYSGEIFDKNVAVILPKDGSLLPAIWCFCSSPEYNESVRRIDQKLNVTNATLVKVPFDLNHWKKVAQEKYPHGLPQPYSEDPTQWIFHGNPRNCDQPLLVAVARLLDYKWPSELDSELELSAECRRLVVECKQLFGCTDEDGIVCIPAVRGEATAADRLHNLLARAYGSDWSNEKLSALLKQLGYGGKSLESWLREKFFTQHCELFHHRPFVWHIWDGLRDGFGALVNYHKFDKKLLESLIYTYLGDWIRVQKEDVNKAIDGAEERLNAAEILKKRLELILEGEAPYDIFVRWKSLEQQPMGWEPDLNDGVRLNIRPFLTVPDVGKKGAGVLRDKPNIKWNKDRGKDVPSSPWYHLFKGDRINDHHLTLAEKLAARNQR